MSKAAVAARMGIAESTVRQYIQRARIKYANAGRPAPTRTQLLAQAIQDGLIRADEVTQYSSRASSSAPGERPGPAGRPRRRREMRESCANWPVRAAPGRHDGRRACAVGSGAPGSQHPQLQPLRRADPERVGPYVLLSRLGAGAMGRVYLGRSASGRLVAVKTIRVEYAEEPDFRARFAREVAAARRVSGVFTAAVVAADPDAAVPWLATAYVPAPSLARLVAACGPLPVPAVRWLAAGCAEALESIHAAGLVHRDLKPSNVLVSQDGPRVIDFGVARAAERAQLTATRGLARHARVHGARAGAGHPAGAARPATSSRSAPRWRTRRPATRRTGGRR